MQPERTPDAVGASWRLAGYQGKGSILSASLGDAAQALQSALPADTIELEHDVTAAGESAASLFESVETGRRHLAYMASGYLAARVPELAVLDLPFSVSNRDQALAALDGEAGRLLREAVSRRTGLQVLAFWDNGFRHISNAVRPLRAPSDCAGLVIRTLDSQTYRDLLGALGFVAVTTDVKELVQAVRQGVVHAQENPLTNLLGFELWRYHPHLSLTGHSFGVLLLVCPQAWYQALTPQRQHALMAAVSHATALQRERAAAQDEVALAQLRQRDVQVLMPDQIDLAAMYGATAAVRQRLLSELPRELCQAYLPAARHQEALH
jgi:TRAP-type C4-dicarboxylate transport system substrate-binding protein